MISAQHLAVAAAPAVADRFVAASSWEHAGREWSSGEQATLTCVRVIAETHDVTTFVFIPPAGAPLSYEPGQFLTLALNINGQPISRCYTISSAPTRPFTLSITVKRVPGGAVSNWLHDTLQPGMSLQAYGPAGMFTPTQHPARKLLYLSAGSGVTPLMSMARASADLGLERDIVFLHSARSPADIIFRDELQALARLSAAFRFLPLCDSAGDEAGWHGQVGRISLALLQQAVPDFREREVFVCGPAGYMQAVRDMLQHGGHDPAHYHQESFDFASVTAACAAAPAATGTAPAQRYSVQLLRSGKTFSMDGAQTVLLAAKKAGVVVPSSCNSGMCGTCKTRLLAGTVAMQHNGGIRPREIDNGLRLLCCSRPTSDLVLDL
ncbi:FAD-binding oxidoreductase [Vogesella facilis]|uniref:FAD-binding oxidoreductase n=1 Tax=Vogesella facilis TaxID=1655232 RepID=A0ABV7RC52_9NEIS